MTSYGVVDASTVDDDQIRSWSQSLEGSSAAEIVGWAVERFGDALCLTSSMSDALLIDIALGVEPSIEVVFLDTQYHFPETLETVMRVQERYRPNLTVMRPDFELDDLWQIDTDLCCDRRKVRQLDRALAGKSAWLSGLRRADSDERIDTPVVQRDRRGLIKVNPIVTWTDEQVDEYLATRDVPTNPLLTQGYPSIGCWPCTQRVGEGADARSGRWIGTTKTECGLHA